MSSPKKTLSGTTLVHADGGSRETPVAPAISVTTSESLEYVIYELS